jgi:hypothetical protein
MLRFAIAAVPLLVMGPASSATNCAAIRSQIEAKVKASGVSSFTLSVVDADARVAGRVVGTCDLGTKKIVYAAANPPTSAQARPKAAVEPMLTECKDGSVSVGGECKK